MGFARPWIILLAPVAAAACDGTSDRPPIDKAVAYQIVAKEDKSLTEGNFKRSIRRVSIYAKAATPEERVHTALKSAIDVQKQDGVDYVESYLLISPHPALVGTGKYLALAQYAPDGKDDSTVQVPLDNGTWSARVTDFTPSELEIKITEVWFANRRRFERQSIYGLGLTQVKIPEMRAFIAMELNIPGEKVKMTHFQVNKWHPR